MGPARMIMYYLKYTIGLNLSASQIQNDFGFKPKLSTKFQNFIPLLYAATRRSQESCQNSDFSNNVINTNVVKMEVLNYLKLYEKLLSRNTH